MAGSNSFHSLTDDKKNEFLKILLTHFMQGCRVMDKCMLGLVPTCSYDKIIKCED